MKASMLRATLVATGCCVLIAHGCMWRRGRGVSPELLPPDKTTSPSRSLNGAREGFGLKEVVGKQEPARFIARDGTTCLVSRDKYDSTALGAAVWCNWTADKP